MLVIINVTILRNGLITKLMGLSLYSCMPEKMNSVKAGEVGIHWGTVPLFWHMTPGTAKCCSGWCSRVLPSHE